MIFERLTRFRLLPALLALAVLFAPLGEAIGQALEEIEQPKLGSKLADRFYKALDGTVRRVIARANRGERLKLELKNSFVDPQGRIFLYAEGQVRFELKRAPKKVLAKLRDLGGTHVWTDGSVASDLMFRSVEEPEPGLFVVHFGIDVIVMTHPLVREVARFGAATLGVIALDFVAGKVIEFLEGLDYELMGDALVAGTEDMTRLLAGEASTGAYERIRQVHQLKDLTVSAIISPYALAVTIGMAILKGATTAGLKFTGLTLGAAVGTALFPASGGAIGALLGGMATVLVGRIIIGKLTVDVPVAYRLWRVRKNRLAGQLDDAEAHEDKLLEAVEEELSAQKFASLDLIAAKLRKTEPREREPYMPLVEKLRKKLQWHVLQNENWVAARKYYQLLEAADRLPYTQETPAAAPAGE